MKLVFLLSTVVAVSLAQQSSFPIETEEKQPRRVYDVVVVGAGLTGLSFARKMKQLAPNATVLLLEARGQVGGRVRARSMSTANGDDWLDLGSQFVSRDHHDLQRIANELGTKLFSQSTCGERTLVLEGVRRIRREVSWSPGLSVRPSFQELTESADATTLVRQSVAEFVQSQKLSTADAAATNRLLQTLFDAPEQKTSALQVALTAASENATVTELLLNTGHGQSLIFEKGAFNFARSMADGLNVEYNEKVIGVNRQSSPAVVMTSGSSFLARQVVVALPPVVASSVVFSPPLEEGFQSFLEQYKPRGDAYYFVLTFPTSFWRAHHKSGQIIHTAEKGPLAWLTTFDLTADTHCVSAAGTTGVLWGIAHFVQENVPEKDRYTSYVSVVKKGLGAEVEPLDVRDMQLSSDPLALGSIGVLPPGASLDWLTYFTGASRHGKNTFFAAAELSSISTGLMNGAVVAGERAADLVAASLTNGSSHPGGFAYSTSTHYPPLDDNIRIMLAPAVARDATSFQYSTSTHYPPAIFDNSVKEDAAVQQDQTQSQFNYQTSSMYPPTERPLETTTYKHFSFGNLNEEEPANMIVAPSTSKQQPQSGSFVYQTSTQYPPTEKPIVTSTYTHFSFGNLGQPGVQPPVPAAVDVYSGGGGSPSSGVVQLRSYASPSVVSELQKVAEQAPTADALSLARNLSGIVQELLQGVKQ